MDTFFIAEAGVNHNGDINKAIELVEIASECGADAVKFQMFNASLLASSKASKADYQKDSTNQSQKEMLQALELKDDDFKLLFEKANSLNIEFMCSAFDEESLEKVINLGVRKLKIPSGEVTNAPFLLSHAHTGLDIILSTGMSTMQDIERAVGFLAFGYSNKKDIPNIDELNFHRKKNKELLEERLTLLHCVSSYPVSHSDQNLKVMKSLKDHFHLKVGYSDHSLGILSSIIAVSLGASVIEKHFTITKKMNGPDHAASLEPQELKELIENLKIVEASLGIEKKGIADSEINVSMAARKSLVAKEGINKGDNFNETNLGIMRPGSGISPIYYWETIGKISKNDYEIGDLIEEEL